MQRPFAPRLDAAGTTLLRLAAEISCVLVPCVAFLALYLGRYGAPPSAVAPHLRILADLGALLACVRLAIACCGVSRPVRRAADTLLLGLAFTCLVGYYALVITGLQSWGRVATSQLAQIYLPRGVELLDVLDIPLYVVGAAALAVVVLGVCLGRLAAARFDWISVLLSWAPRRAIEYGAVAVFVAAVADVGWYTLRPPVDAQEPLALSFFPWDATLLVGPHTGMDKAASAQRGAREDDARRRYTKAAAATRHNLVLIVVDSFRADHTSLYGYARDTTPYLAYRAAGRGARLSPAVRTSCAETVCGVMSLLGSRYVHRFSPRMFTLHEVLGAHGYRRILLIADDHTHFYDLRGHYGTVEEYHDASTAHSPRMFDDQDVVDRVRSLPKWDGATPVMLHLHLMSAHALGYLHDDSLKWRPVVNYFYPANRVDAGGRLVAAATNYYDDGVNQADRVIHDVLEALEAKGYLRDSLVVVTGDHGESLGEKDKWGHGNSVYEEVLRVPLLMLSQGYEPAPLRARSPAQVDIAPTILAELGIPAPDTWQGSPLQQPEQSHFAYFQQGAFIGLLDRQSGWKYWQDTASHRDFASTVVGTRASRPTANTPASLLSEWRKAVMPLAAESLVPTR